MALFKKKVFDFSTKIRYFFNCFSKTNNPIEKSVRATEDNFVVNILSKFQVIRIKIGRDMRAPSYKNVVSRKTRLKFYN